MHMTPICYELCNRHTFIHFHNRWYAVIGLTLLSYRSTVATKFSHINHNLCVSLSYIFSIFFHCFHCFISVILYLLAMKNILGEKLWILDMLPLKCGIYVTLPHISRNKEEWARHWMSCKAHLNDRKWRFSKLGHYNWTYLWTFKELIVGCMSALKIICKMTNNVKSLIRLMIGDQ